MTPSRDCLSNNKAGNPCGGTPIKGADHCHQHSSDREKRGAVAVRAAEKFVRETWYSLALEDA